MDNYVTNCAPRIGIQVKIYPNDHPPAHVVKAENEARVTLTPVELKTNTGFNTREISDILDMIRQHRAELLAEWDKIHPSR